ncbi:MULTISPECIES: hypothetical protein [Acidiphilium]|uniref:hypothetical protein n=1 Tax=Acidiphilium TaxID=522 RepID=UPI00257DEB1E|nr:MULTISPECIES: hypothetical protein [Acidiphilium]HQT83511.1 hypothetical protein [Acidiphilium rubrum]
MNDRIGIAEPHAMHHRSLFNFAAAAIGLTPVGHRAAMPPQRPPGGPGIAPQAAIDDDWLIGHWIAMPEAQFGDSDALS